MTRKQKNLYYINKPELARVKEINSKSDSDLAQLLRCSVTSFNRWANGDPIPYPAARLLCEELVCGFSLLINTEVRDGSFNPEEASFLQNVDSVRLGKVLRQFRGGITIKDIARNCGVSSAAVHLWEAGKHCPDMQSLQLLGDFYQVPIKEFLK